MTVSLCLTPGGCDREQWKARAEAAEAALARGDNHHNAVLCPYCNPRRLQWAEPGARAPDREAVYAAAKKAWIAGFDANPQGDPLADAVDAAIAAMQETR